MLLEVGRIVKPHGLAGEVVVELWTDREERVVPGSVLETGEDTLVVAASRPHQGRHLVRFASVATREEAEELRGAVLRAEALEEPGTLWVHELVGARVVTTTGVPLGTVTAVEANPASDLLVCSDGTLVPLRFVTSVEPGTTLTVDVPEGLVD